jgi:hypothetical protein
MISRFAFIFFIFIFFSCKNQTKKSDIEIYNQKSTELIQQILTREEIECSCLAEVEHKSLLEIIAAKTPRRNNRKDLKSALDIKDDSIFDKQNKLSKKFRIFKLNLKFGLTLLDLNKLDSILINSGEKNHTKNLWEKCPLGIFSLSPPVFNETYDIAVIEVGSCISGSTLDLYHFINGRWVFIDFIYVSIG